MIILVTYTGQFEFSRTESSPDRAMSHVVERNSINSPLTPPTNRRELGYSLFVAVYSTTITLHRLAANRDATDDNDNDAGFLLVKANIFNRTEASRRSSLHTRVFSGTGVCRNVLVESSNRKSAVCCNFIGTFCQHWRLHRRRRPRCIRWLTLSTTSLATTNNVAVSVLITESCVALSRWVCIQLVLMIKLTFGVKQAIWNRSEQSSFAAWDTNKSWLI